MRRTRETPRVAVAALAATLTFGAALAAQVDDHRDIDYPPLAEFEIPRPEIYELGNGLRVFLLEDHELPLIEVMVRVRTGSAWEPAEKTGLAELAGAVQRTGGSRSMTGDEIDDFLEARAASVETTIGTTVGFASMDCLSQDFEDVFAVFYEVLRYPRFAEEKLEIAKVQARSGVARRNDNVNAIAGREFTRLVYGPDSPLSRITEYATLDAVDRDDLVAWHQRHYHPNQMLLGIVGDFNSEEMRRRIAETFDGWERGPAAETPPIVYLEASEPGVFFIEKTDVAQADVRLGHLGIRIQNPDYFAVQVMNEVLSGGFSGRLMRSIRSTRGLAYGVGGGVGSSFLYPGVAGFTLQTKSQSMGEAVDALYEEIRGMIAEPPDEAEILRAKDTILNSFVFNYATRDRVLAQQMLYAYYGLPLDFLERYRENIEKVTAAEVAEVAARYLHPDEARLLVVGNSADFDRPLSSFGEVTELDISIPPPPSDEPPVERTEATERAGRELLARMVREVGGEAAGSAAAIRRTGEVVLSMQGQTVAIGQTTIVVFPDRIYSSSTTPMGEQVVVIRDGEGFVTRGGQTQPLPADRVAQQLEDLGRDLNYIVRYHDAEDLVAVAAGDSTAGGVPCTELVVSLRGAESRICIGAEGLPLRQTYSGSHPLTGAPGSFEVLFSDYREVGGRKLPHKRVTRIDGADFATATLDALEVDPEIAPGLFERPAA